MRTKLTVLGNQGIGPTCILYLSVPQSSRSSRRERQGVNASGKSPLISNASCPDISGCLGAHILNSATSDCRVWLNYPSCIQSIHEIQLRYFLQQKCPGEIQCLYLQHPSFQNWIKVELQYRVCIFKSTSRLIIPLCPFNLGLFCLLLSIVGGYGAKCDTL